MVELIAVMVIMAILAVVSAPKFFDRGIYDSRGFYDEVISTLRYAQKEAIAQHRLVCVTFPSASRVMLRTAALFTDTSCNTNLKSPGGRYPADQTTAALQTYTVDAPSAVSLSGYADFKFNALGKPDFTSSEVIQVSGYTATPITIEAETGYVR